MNPPKEKAALLGSAGGSGLQPKFDDTASVATCNKWLTLWRYSHGHLSLEGCEAAFAAHPEWRAV